VRDQAGPAPERATARTGGLERDVAVLVGGRAAAPACPGAGGRGLAARGAVLAVALAVQEGQHPVVGRQVDLGREPVGARLVLPPAGPDGALDVDLGALAKVGFGDLAQALVLMLNCK